MKSATLILFLPTMAVEVGAAEWEFSHAIPVTTVEKSAVFYHIDSSGRKNIAVSATTIAVAWEDNRSGASQIYVAFNLDQQRNRSRATITLRCWQATTLTLPWSCLDSPRHR